MHGLSIAFVVSLLLGMRHAARKKAGKRHHVRDLSAVVEKRGLAGWTPRR
jgi:hypothetical protein